MRAHVLIVYGTSYGQTAKIASRMQTVLADEGVRSTVIDSAEVTNAIDPDAYDGILIGASIIVGKHQAAVARFIRRHLATLNRLPSAFFSVSGAAGSPDPAEQAEARRIAEAFLARLGWRPTTWTTVAGGFPFTKYSWLMRWMMRRITKRGGLTDTSRDYELTDWAAVDAFAHRFAQVVTPAAPLADAKR